MKTKLLPTLLLSLLSTAALAQPTITSSNNPQPGDAFTWHNSNMSNPGTAGANQTWDFSAAMDTTTQGPQVFHIVACSATTDCDSFPGANIVGVVDDTTYSYMNANTSRLTTLGTKSGNTISIHYTDPDDVIRYPFTYQSTFSDTVAGFITGDSINLIHHGTSTVTGDAYGTLKTPAGTFSNVLRIHTHRETLDSMDIGEGLWLSFAATIDEYAWYSTASHQPLYAITSTTSAAGSGVAAQWYDTPAGISSLSGVQNGLSVFPQPARGTLQLRFQSEQAAQLSMQLTDISGRVVKNIPAQNFAAGKNEKTIEVQDLSAGLYMLTVMNGTQRVAVQKVVVE